MVPLIQKLPLQLVPKDDESKNPPTSREAGRGNCAALEVGGVADSYTQGRHHSGHRFLFALVWRSGFDHMSKENLWVIELHLRWDSTGDPVLDTLNTTVLTVIAKKFSYFGGTTELFNEFCISHASIKHHV